MKINKLLLARLGILIPAILSIILFLLIPEYFVSVVFIVLSIGWYLGTLVVSDMPEIAVLKIFSPNVKQIESKYGSYFMIPSIDGDVVSVFHNRYVILVNMICEVSFNGDIEKMNDIIDEKLKSRYNFESGVKKRRKDKLDALKEWNGYTDKEVARNKKIEEILRDGVHSASGKKLMDM